MTTVTHPLTGEQLPLKLNAKTAAKAVGESWPAIVKLCEDGEITCAPHDQFKQWWIYTIPLLARYGMQVSMPEQSPPGQSSASSAGLPEPARGGDS